MSVWVLLGGGMRAFAAVMSLSWDVEKAPPLPGRAFSSSSLRASISRGGTKWGLSPEKHHLTVERQWVKARPPSDLQGADEERNSRKGGVSSTTPSLCWYLWSVSHSVVSDFCDPMGCSLPGSSVHGILRARILEWVAISLLQGIFPTQGSNPGLLVLQADALPSEPPLHRYLWSAS